MKLTSLVCFSSLVLGCSALYAQSTTATTTAPTVTRASINDRKVDQQDRIAQGLKSGELTATGAAKLETQEAGINKEEAGMRAQDDGKLTTEDKATLTSQQNAESKEIYADKHNAAVQPPADNKVNDRLTDQQVRIANGIDKDKLSDTQVAHLETQEAGIHTQEVGMREQDNGKLTAADKKLLSKEQNEESRRILREERRHIKK